MPSDIISVLFPRHLVRLTATLLEMLSEELSKHGCNDFSIEAFIPSREEAIEFVKGADASEFDETRDNPFTHMGDWFVAGHMASIFRTLVDVSSADPGIVSSSQAASTVMKDKLREELEDTKKERDRWIKRMQKLERRCDEIQAILNGKRDEE